MKIKMLLSLLAATSFVALNAEGERVYVNMEKVLVGSRAGKEIQEWHKQKNSELQQLVAKRQNELKGKELELYEAREENADLASKALALDTDKRLATVEIESRGKELELQLNQKITEHRTAIGSTITKYAKDKSFAEVADTKDLLYHDPKFDKTAELIEAYDKQCKVDKASLKLVSGPKAKDAVEKA